ncbi:hypothetical protein [Metabacillus herbersteinensis]
MISQNEWRNLDKDKKNELIEETIKELLIGDIKTNWEECSVAMA